MDAVWRSEGASGEEAMAMHAIAQALHDLCQPLTTLRCSLEVAEMVGGPEAYRDGVHTGLIESSKVIAALGVLRSAVHAAMAAVERKHTDERRLIDSP